MTEEVKDGGAAFPIPSEQFRGGIVHPPQPGMSLRDWFAGQAIIGIAAYAQEPVPAARLAEAAYKLADALLSARKDHGHE